MICLGWCGLSVPAVADQPFAMMCMANSFASTSDLKVRVERTAPVALSSVFTVLSGPKATYQVSGCVMRQITLIIDESFPAQQGRPKGGSLHRKFRGGYYSTISTMRRVRGSTRTVRP